MKIQEKHIMGSLLIGGLIISLYFTISAYRKTQMQAHRTYIHKPVTACRLIQNDAPSFCIRMIKKFITN